ncbi:disintegrin and metalloproteinase domain-containing protein 9-like [Aplochiton taeniatus]
MFGNLLFATALLLFYISGTDNKDISVGPTSKLSSYTVVIPQLIHRRTRSSNRAPEVKETHKESLTYSLLINNQKHLLHLKKNRNFLSKNLVQYSHEASGDYKPTFPKQEIVNCYYHGHVDGHDDSLVALSTCSGLSGVIFLGNASYGLEPDLQSTRNEHLLYQLKSSQSAPFVCGMSNGTSQTDSHLLSNSGHDGTSFLRDEIGSNQAPSTGHICQGVANWQCKSLFFSIECQQRKRNLPDTRYVELVLVADNLRYTKKNGNETAVREEIVSIANLLDGYYKQLNIRVALVGLEIFKQANPFDVQGFAGDVLGRFVQWRKASLLPRIRHDVAQLIIGRSGAYPGGILGMAFVGTVCSVSSSGGINVFSDDSLPYFSTVVAHEMGHNLGMNHDTTRCLCNGGSCIMAPAASGSTSFSTCSANDFENLVLRGGGVCLKNPAFSLITVAKCGNGLLEKGEQCDCGTPKDCTDKCCDAATCSFSSGSACAQGSCCSNCQIKVSGTPCRGSVNSCDLPEYCNGSSAFCPVDFYIMDGLPCEDQTAYCYEGRCQTYDYQCKHLFESRATKASDTCFQYANTKGDLFGNCGIDASGGYTKCTVANAMCGKVQCANVDVNNPPPGAQVSIQFIGGSQCVNADFNLGNDVRDPAYVNPGSPCAAGKTCLAFACVNASTLLPLLDCDAQRTCNSHGVCNDQGHCHCDDGWGPPLCDKAGRGGSVDSGPAQIDYSLRNGLLIFFLLVVPVLVLLILVLLYVFKRDSLNRCIKPRRASSSR